MKFNIGGNDDDDDDTFDFFKAFQELQETNKKVCYFLYFSSRFLTAESTFLLCCPLVGHLLTAVQKIMKDVSNL